MPLQGSELEEFLEKERLAKEKAAARKAADERRQRILEADEGESDDDDDSDSDSDDENEVERALDDDEGSADHEHSPQRTKERKRRGGKHKDIDGAGWGDIDIEGDDGVTRNIISYDIYLKGHVSKTTSFFKSADGQTQRFRMFPYVEKRRRVDEYGEVLDVGMWLRKGKALEEDTQDDDMKEMKRLNAEEEAKVRNSTASCHQASLTKTYRKRLKNLLRNSLPRKSKYN